MENTFRFRDGVRFTDYLREDGETGSLGTGGNGGTCSADIAPVTYPVGAILRRKKRDDYLEAALEIRGKESDIPGELEEELTELFREAVLEENCITDNAEIVLSSFFNEEWRFDGFSENKSVLEFSSRSGSLRIFQ